MPRAGPGRPGRAAEPRTRQPASRRCGAILPHLAGRPATAARRGRRRCVGSRSSADRGRCRRPSDGTGSLRSSHTFPPQSQDDHRPRRDPRRHEPTHPAPPPADPQLLPRPDVRRAAPPPPPPRLAGDGSPRASWPRRCWSAAAPGSAARRRTPPGTTTTGPTATATAASPGRLVGHLAPPTAASKRSPRRAAVGRQDRRERCPGRRLGLRDHPELGRADPDQRPRGLAGR